MMGHSPISSAAVSDFLRAVVTVIVSTPTAIRVALFGNATQNSPERVHDARTGDVDTSAASFRSLLAGVDTVAGIVSIGVARRDGAAVTGNDLTVTPAGHSAPWVTGGAVVNWWQSSALAADYQVTVTVTTAAGRTLRRDLYQRVDAALG